jgi:sigma-E factor negative regulatory protein RseC
MDRASGKIISVHADTATVSVANTGCPRCAAGKGCGAGLLTGRPGSTEVELQLPAGHHYRLGDEVTLSIASSSLLRAALLAYGLPLAGTVLALTVGWLVMAPLSDLAGALIALAGLLAGFIAGRNQLRKDDWCKQFVPSIDSRNHDAAAHL